ncbi:hypothetical protein TKK_0003452, partial [Trichogramma kaykai]
NHQVRRNLHVSGNQGQSKWQTASAVRVHPDVYIVREAGGLASNGERDILDVLPTSIHQRSPIYLGSEEDVQDVLEFIKHCK